MFEEQGRDTQTLADHRNVLFHGFRAGVFLFAGVLMVPALVSLLSGVPFPLILAVIGSTLVIEYAAVVPGAALQVPAYVTVTVAFSTALGIIAGSLEIFEALFRTSPALSGFIARARNRSAGKFTRKYGIWGLVPAILAAGFYITPGLAFVLGMPKSRSVAIMSGAFFLGELITLAIATGVLRLL